MCARLGYSREELLAKSVFDITVDESSDTWRERWRLPKEQRPHAFERQHRTKNGDIIPVEIWSSTVEYEGGQVVLAIARDIRERKRAEAELALTGYSVNHASDSVLWLDPNGRIVFVSESTCERHGYSRDELMAMTVYDLDPDLSHEHWTENWRRIKAEGVMNIETTHRTKDGEVIPLELKANYVAFGGAEYNCVFGRDITERRRVEEALRERDEQLRQAQKMEAVGQLAGGIAHDFNNLLAAVVGYSDLLLARDGAFDVSVREDIEEIRRAADRASSLTRQILAFSRRQALRPTVTSLNAVVEGMDPLLRRTLGEDIDLVTVADPDLGLVEVDIHQFEQVLMNLAVNARDAMPSGGRLMLETANVDLDADYCGTHLEASVGPHVILAVSDTGTGMDEATVERIFEPFFTTKAGDKGTGLGLSMVYGTVKQSNGSISVASEPGKGARFEIYLPRLTAMAKEATPAVADAEPALGSGIVLVVEDEPSLQRLVARVLKGLGYRVIVAGTAAEALQLARQERHAIDMLLTDVVLPGNLQGNDLARELLAIKPGLAVLYTSGYTRNAIVHAGRLDPGVNFLEKPFAPEALGNAVREVLSRRKA